MTTHLGNDLLRLELGLPFYCIGELKFLISCTSSER